MASLKLKIIISWHSGTNLRHNFKDLLGLVATMLASFIFKAFQSSWFSFLSLKISSVLQLQQFLWSKLCTTLKRFLDSVGLVSSSIAVDSTLFLFLFKANKLGSGLTLVRLKFSPAGRLKSYTVPICSFTSTPVSTSTTVASARFSTIPSGMNLYKFSGSSEQNLSQDNSTTTCPIEE